jgi:hypothetical protein
MDTTESIGDENQREPLRERIRSAALELLELEEVSGLSFPLAKGGNVYIGMALEMITDCANMCVSINGEACYTAEELRSAAWRSSEER